MNHQAKKSLGQHFLHDAGTIAKIVKAIDPHVGEQVVEIGPGQGAITLPLLRALGRLTVIELDRDLLAPLAQMAQPLGELHIVHADVLTVNFSALVEASRIRLVGNLPYNISSPILFHALEHAEAIQDMHFMLQKEVVERMAATPGSKTYGRLSVMLQAYCEVTALMRVPPGAFRPPPKVESAVVRLIPYRENQVTIQDRQVLSVVVKAAFAQRRKTLRNTLAGVCDEAALSAAGIDPGARAETVTVPAFIALANRVAAGL